MNKELIKKLAEREYEIISIFKRRAQQNTYDCSEIELSLINQEKHLLEAELLQIKNDIDIAKGPALKISSEQAFNVIKQAMIDDDPEKPGSYAHGWHCNIAMMCYDAIMDDNEETGGSADDTRLHEYAHRIGNESATRFMKLCFDVDTTNELNNIEQRNITNKDLNNDN